MPDPITTLNAALAGRYEIERQIGQGGMATVYLAEDLKHHRKVALKVLKPELAAIIGADRFLAEIETTAHLQHPNILPLFDSGEADGSVFFVMPYVEEETLRGRLSREKQLPVDEAVRIAREVAEALDYAHRKGVIHRDIKPGNILLRDGRPLVADFGIALAASRSGSGERLTETGLSLGTPFYMSPEQATGSQEIGPATDVYALGCVLYEMLVGEPPHTGSTPQAVLGKIITGDPKSVTGQRRSVPPNVDGAIAKAIEKLPADRFGSAKEFAKALTDPGFRYGERALGGAGRAGPWKFTALASSLVAATFAIIAGWALLRPEPPKPVTRFALSQPPGVDIDGGPDGIRGFAVSPDGRTVVFADGPTGQLYRHDLSSFTAVPIQGAENTWYPFFSPDGAWVGYIDQADNILKKVRLDGTQAQPLVTVPPPGRSAAWSPDGTIIVYSDSEGGRLWRVSEAGGELDSIPNTVGPGWRWLDMLPNGQAVLASMGDTIFAVSLETGERSRLVAGGTPRFVSTGHIVFWRDNALWAEPFDPGTLETFGSAVPIIQDVGSGANGLAHFAVGGGTLSYLGGQGLYETPVWIDRDGGREVLDPSLSGRFRAPAISPDGRKIAFQYTSPGESAEHIWIYDLDQRTFSRLTFEGWNGYPFWSPDGTEVGFSSERDGYWALYSRPVDLSRDARLLRSEPDAIDLGDGGWTPDGGRLVYGRANSVSFDILQSGRDPDSAAVAVVATRSVEANPAISPDGRWLAYTSNEEGLYEVYVRPFPGPGGQTKISTNGGINPIWAHNGEEIYYLTLGLGLTPISWAGARLRFDPTPLVQSRSEPFPFRPMYWKGPGIDWDLSPDDQRVLVIGASGDGSEEVEGQYVVVENFDEELERLAPD